MKFKIGDIARVKTWEEMEKEFGVKTTNWGKYIPVECLFHEKMKKWCGRLVEITSVNTLFKHYTIKDVETNSRDSVFRFSDDMLKPISAFEKMFSNMKPKCFEEFVINGSSLIRPTQYKFIFNWVINEKKKTVVLYNEQKKVIIKCHEEDTFNLEIGVGLALSKFLDCKKYRAMREFFRNKRKKLDYKKYASWVILDYCGYNYTKRNKFLEELEEKSTKEFEIVEVINRGRSYTTYEDWFSFYKLDNLLKRYHYNYSAKNGQKYKVLAKHPHTLDESIMLYAIEDLKTQKVYLISENGLKLKGDK